MAQTSVRLNATKWGFVNTDNPNTVIDISSMTEFGLYGTYSFLFIGFESFPTALKHNVLYYPSIKLAAKNSGNSRKLYGYGCSGTFDSATLTYNNKPAVVTPQLSTGSYVEGSYKDYNITSGAGVSVSAQTQGAKAMAAYCTARIGEQYGNGYITAKKGTLSDGSTIPYLDIFYDDSIVIGSKIEVTSGATGGNVNPEESTSFSWQYTQDNNTDYLCLSDDYEQTSATFYWKVSTDESYTAIQISGTTKSLTIPANTFAGNSTIQWYIEGTDDSGTTSQTTVYSFSTAAATAVAQCVDPKDEIIDGGSAYTFRWTISSSDGRAASRVRVSWQLASNPISSETWYNICDVNEAITSYVVPANTIAAGEIRWLVRVWNADSVEGTRDYATFINYAAPTVSNVSATAVPFSSVTWQATDQQAYQIRVDGTVVYGTYFGSEKTFSLPWYLDDGTHTIEVRTLGTYSLWSEWVLTQVAISNVSGDPVDLSVSTENDATLIITTEGNITNYYILRNGTVIGHTNNEVFVDRFSYGTNEYQVLNKLSDGNYTLSAEIEATITLDCPVIALLSGGDWVELKYSEQGQKDPEYEATAESVYNHLAGDTYPSVILSGYQERSMSYSALFLYDQVAELAAFYALFGKAVVLKMRDGTVFFGVLDNWRRQHRKNYWTSFSFTIHKIEWEDYVDDTE